MPKLDNMRVQAHEFNKTITIQRAQPGINEDNIYINDNWIDLLKTRAKVKTDKTDEELMLQGEGNLVVKTFTIRARKDIKIKSSDRIVYKNQIYNIKSAENVQEKDILIVIKAEYKEIDINSVEDNLNEY